MVCLLLLIPQGRWPGIRWCKPILFFVSVYLLVATFHLLYTQILKNINGVAAAWVILMPLVYQCLFKLMPLWTYHPKFEELKIKQRFLQHGCCVVETDYNRVLHTSLQHLVCLKREYAPDKATFTRKWRAPKVQTSSHGHGSNVFRTTAFRWPRDKQTFRPRGSAPKFYIAPRADLSCTLPGVCPKGPGALWGAAVWV